MNLVAADGSTPLHDAARADNIAATRCLIESGGKLDIEDQSGKTPIMIAIEHSHFDIANTLVSSGAALTRSRWEVLTSEEHKFRLVSRKTSQWPRIERDVLEVYSILKSRGSKKVCLPRAVIRRILDFSGYWLSHTWERSELIEYDDKRADLKVPYLMTDPLSFPARGRVCEVAFTTRSHDQGTSDWEEQHGTYEGSCTWFEVAIQKADGGWHDFGTETTTIVVNVHASSQTKEHCQVYGRYWPRTKCKWLDSLRHGDRIAVVPRAKYLDWVNFVESIIIEVAISCV